MSSFPSDINGFSISSFSIAYIFALWEFHMFHALPFKLNSALCLYIYKFIFIFINLSSQHNHIADTAKEVEEGQTAHSQGKDAEEGLGKVPVTRHNGCRLTG